MTNILQPTNLFVKLLKISLDIVTNKAFRVVINVILFTLYCIGRAEKPRSAMGPHAVRLNKWQNQTTFEPCWLPEWSKPNVKYVLQIGGARRKTSYVWPLRIKVIGVTDG